MVGGSWLYPNAIPIRVVMDNLSPHKAASLYEVFPTAEAPPEFSRGWSFISHPSTVVG